MINMQQGRIIKIISNQYTIQNEKEEIIAKPRGKMRQHEAPVVGDFVEYEKIVAIFAQYVKKVSILNEISYANWRYYLYFFWGPYAFHSYKAASACLTAEKPL